MPECPFCGADVASSDRNCSNCGALLEWTSGSPAEGAGAGAEVQSSDREIIELVQSRGKIAAIKRYREVHRVGLKEAKERVESLMEHHGVIAGRGRGCAAVLLVATFLVWAAIAAASG